jgi:hypothetical protein
MQWPLQPCTNFKFLMCVYIHRDVLTFVDQFMALCFTVTGALPAARRIRILLINQYAWWPITFGIMFHGEQRGPCMEICQWFVSRGWRLSAPLAIWYLLQLVSSVFCHGAIYFRAALFLYDTYVKYESDRKHWRKFWYKFHDENIPSRQTIHNLVNKLRSMGLLIDKKQKHKHWVLTEEKLDDIRTRLVHTPKKSLKCLDQETGMYAKFVCAPQLAVHQSPWSTEPWSSQQR